MLEVSYLSVDNIFITDIDICHKHLQVFDACNHVRRLKEILVHYRAARILQSYPKRVAMNN
jgi:hypothetical protein